MSDITSTGRTSFYFMGICGTAMGAVAAALKDLGHDVSGSDSAVYPPMSDFLREKGISILDGYRAENVPEDAGVIVVGNAMSRGNAEVEETLNRRLRYASLPEVLKDYFLRGKRNLVVSGTHGKTTTSSLLAWLLDSSGKAPNFMIGGIPANFGKGSRMGGASDFVVLEGDEYDTAFFDKRSKFVHYLPEMVIVNNIEFDHADIFDSVEDIKLAFRRMLQVVPQNGLVVINGDDPHCLEVAKGVLAPVVPVGFQVAGEGQISEVESLVEGVRFRLGGEPYFLPMVGEFNVRNAAVALTVARHAGIPTESLQAGLERFQGVARRQQVRGETARGICIIDDFGHHPTAMGHTLEAIRGRYPGQRLWALFEPRSNTTRRNVFQRELPQALEKADGICISAVARKEQLAEGERLDPDAIVTTLREKGKLAYHEEDADAIVARLSQEARRGDVVIVFSNGGFGGIHEKLLASL